VALFKEFKLLSFDADFAAAQGWPTFALDFGAMALLAVVTIVGLPICGVILMAAMVILPSAAARYWTNQLGTLLVLAGVFGAAAGAGGTLLASPLAESLLGFDPLAFGDSNQNLPPGPLIVLSAAALLILSLVVAPGQGIVARSIAELRLRSRIVREHLLRSMYELSEPHLPALPAVAMKDLVDYRSWSRWHVDLQLRRAAARGLLRVEGDAIRLTPDGLVDAAELTKAHRLWEVFLVEHANIAADHVDRDADDVEHLLPAPLLAELEQHLAEEGRLPIAPERIPESPHQLESP
jgi:manganese/zinc/iron transport system permease protein